MSARVVIDTNVVISRHLSRSNESVPQEIFGRWRTGDFDLLYQADILREYIEVLLRHGIARDTIRRFIAILIKDGNRVKIRFFHLPKYPDDADDIPFLLCALNGDATHLISYDDHILKLGRAYSPLTICRPHQLLEELD